jgi:hypothetical protein
LILTFSASNLSNIRDLLLSIRSIGIRARVVVVVLETTIIPQDIETTFNSCNIEVFRADGDRISSSKFTAYQQFLEEHGSEFDRILHVNPENTYFQGDPFTDSITSDGFNVVLEGLSIGQSSTDSAVMSSCYGDLALAEVEGYEIAMAGIFGGQRNSFELFVGLMSNLTAKQCNLPGADQAHLNHLIWSNEWFDFEIPFRFHGCTSGIIAAPYCLRSTLDSYRLFVGVTGKEVSILHEYRELSTIVRYIHQMCNVTLLSS